MRAGTSRIGMRSAPSMRALSYSQGSRTSRSTGFSRCASPSQAASSPGVITPMSEAETRRLLGVRERAYHGLEEIDAAPGAGRRAEGEARLHCGGFAHHGEQAPARIELLEKSPRQHRRRARQHDSVVGRVLAPATRRVAGHENYVVRAVALEVLAPEGCERRSQLHRADFAGTVGEECGQIAAAGAYFQHAVGLLQRELLQHACLELRLPHPLALACPCSFLKGQLQVGESKRAVLRGHELLARDHIEKVKHLLIQHLPGADLLLDHVETRLF